ncbi:exonuclease domain-containing protein [Colwelliaceae bacterium MEBiC 14330]
MKRLPKYYYLSNFHEFLSFFDGKSIDLLPIETRRFIDNFRQLSQPMQCIIARAANRKHTVFSRHGFTYEEIETPQQQLQWLVDHHWFSSPLQAPLAELTSALTKAELIQCLQKASNESALTSANKARLQALFAQHINTIKQAQCLQDSHLYAAFTPHLRYLLFLYFGRIGARLNQFSLRDLGVTRTHKDTYAQGQRFENKQDAQGAYYYASLLQDTGTSVTKRYNLAKLPKITSDNASIFKDKFCYLLGKAWLTRDIDYGLLCLQRSNNSAAQEAWLRAQYKRGNKQQVEQHLQQLLQDPPNDKLALFAEDFYARKFAGKRTSPTTDMLRASSQTLAIDINYKQSVERGVAAKYRSQGDSVIRSENRLWRALFGLTFWPILFAQGSLITAFDRKPAMLRNNQFYAKYHTEIEQQLECLLTTTNALMFFTQQCGRYYGKPNGLFRWHTKLLDYISVFIEHASLQAMVTILRLMAKDFRTYSDGFPDIMRIHQGQVIFEEIKAPGDSLRRNQLLTIRQLQQAGFRVAITQVEWFHDPQQSYVVVDVETTGGKHEQHRVTEVGMVKVVNGAIIDRWQSLIDPQRHIPSAITRLTGISNTMVQGQPRFIDVLEQIDAFSQDCIFVAHNVNFDYHFFRSEFARCGRDFVRPKLCTVQLSRQKFKGLNSYSLGALAQHFNLNLQNHHRALDDAEAAAQLLIMSQG